MTAIHSSVDNMNKATQHASAYSRHIGRAGALAAALGIGLLVATSPGVASADTTSPDSSSPSGGTTGADSTTDTGATSTGTGTAVASPVESSTTGTSSSATTDGGSSTTDTTTTSGATSSSIQVAPGVTISANSIKIGSKTLLLDLGTKKKPTNVQQPVGEVIETSEGSTPPVDPAPETGQAAPTALKSESRSSRPVAANNVTSPLSTAVSKLGSSVGEVDQALKTVKQLSAKLTESSAAPIAEALNVNTASSAVTASAATAVIAPVAPTAPVAAPVTGVVGFLNQVVTNLLNPLLTSDPTAPGPVNPVALAVLGWVRRNAHVNEAPTITYDPASTTQTGQTVTGTLATDPEGDALTYTVTGATPVEGSPSTWKTENGTLTIDQATNKFTYTPDDINYDGVQTDSFTVTVTDGKLPNGMPLPPKLPTSLVRSDTETINVTVQPPTVERVILNMPDTVTRPVNPRYSEDGTVIYFSGSPAVGGVATAGVRKEIYQIDADDVDGSTVKCVTCDATTTETLNLEKPVPFTDGTGRIIVLINRPNALDSFSPTYSVYEPAGYNGNTEARIVPIVTPDGGGANPPPGPLAQIFPDGIVDRQREMRVSPDGEHVLFTRIVVGQTGNFQALPIVGELKPNATGDQYVVENAVVVWPTGEGKQWTHDGKGVIIQGGTVDAGNIDDIYVDLSGQTGESLFPGAPTWKGTRVTGNPDYDEDIDMSPNNQWITVGSTRGFDALTPMTQIQRENFLPVYLAGVYTLYADDQVRNVSNQNWAVAVEDDLNGENGIRLFVQDDPSTPLVDEGDGYASRSMPSWNPDGTAVTFWESGNGDEHGIAPTESRLVIANLKYTTSTGVPLTEEQTTTVFDRAAFKPLNTYVAGTTPLPAGGASGTTYNGPNGGTATVTDDFSTTTFKTTRTVTYNNYVNEDGLVLTGFESATYGPDQNSVLYNAEIEVFDATTGEKRGYLHAKDVTNQIFPTQTISAGSDGRGIESSLDGNLMFIPDLEKAEDAKTGA